MFCKLSPFVEGILICRGDSNLALDLSLDKFNPVTVWLRPCFRPSKESTRVAKLLRSLNLVDAWKELNRSTNVYTFSAPHSTYSRIDHIFLSSTGIPSFRWATIRESAWSDHLLVLLVILSLTFHIPSSRQWCLNKSLFSDPCWCEDVRIAILDYFRHIINADDSPGMTWADHKFTIRGHLIHISQLKKDCIAKIDHLDQDLQSLIKAHKCSPIRTLLQKIDTTRV